MVVFLVLTSFVSEYLGSPEDVVERLVIDLAVVGYTDKDKVHFLCMDDFCHDLMIPQRQLCGAFYGIISVVQVPPSLTLQEEKTFPNSHFRLHYQIASCPKFTLMALQLSVVVIFQECSMQ